RNLFPGLFALMLALAGACPPIGRGQAAYCALLVVSVWAALGYHSALYPVLYRTLAPIRGLRVPARFNIVALLSVAVLAGFGVDRLGRVSSRLKGSAALAIAVVIFLIEYAAYPRLAEIVRDPLPVYKWLNTFPIAPVAELPMPSPGGLPGPDPMYLYYSTWHWRPLLNGYSGYYPLSYVHLMDSVERFP